MRLGIAALVLWTLANFAFSARLLTSDQPVETSADNRTPIQLTVEARDAVLAEMRMMLGSVHGVVEGAARSDTAAIRAAAKASGMAMAADPALEKALPRNFMQLGMATHAAFDTLAARASDGTPAAIDRLGRILSTCVNCHATYRLELKSP